jgi:hypothetical protein
MALIVAGLAAIGYAPTRRLAGEIGLAAMFAGIAVSVAASVAGTVPLLLATAEKRAQAALLSMLVRFLVAAALAAAVALGSGLPVKPLLIWLGASYAALLPLDATFAARWSHAGGEET